MHFSTANTEQRDRSTFPHAGQLAVMTWAHFLNDGATNYLPGVLPAILLTLHLPVAYAGTVMAALLIGQTAQPIFGWLADRAGGRAFIVYGVGGTALGGALVGLAPTFGSLVGILILIGVSNSMFHPQALAAVRHLGVRKTGLVMATFLVGGELGRGVWPVVASFVVVGLGLKMLWLLAIPACLTLPLLAYKVPRLAMGHRGHGTLDWRRAWNDLALIVAFRTMRAVLLFSTVTFVPLVWQAHGGSLVGGASLLTTFLVVGIVGNIGGGHFADRFGRRAVLAVTSGLSTLFLAVFLLVSGLGQWLALAGLGVVMFASLPVTVLMGQDALPENRSLGSGLTVGFSNGLGAIIVMLLGLLTLRWGVEIVLWANVGLAVANTGLVPFLPREGRSTP